MLSLGSEKPCAVSCLLACCVLQGGWEVWPFIAVSRFVWRVADVLTLQGRSCLVRAAAIKSHSLHRWITAAQLSLLAG